MLFILQSAQDRGDISMSDDGVNSLSNRSDERIDLSERKSKVGLPPGTPVHTGIDREEKVSMYVVEFNQTDMREYWADSLDDCAPPDKDVCVKWIHVNGVHDIKILEALARYYSIHPLVLEDIPSVGQRPRIELMSSGIHTVLRAFGYDEMIDDITSEQVSIIIGDRYLLSFQETATSMFDSVVARMRRPGSRLRKNDSDYLAYTLLDIIVDNYFGVLEMLGEMIEDLEDALIRAQNRTC